MLRHVALLAALLSLSQAAVWRPSFELVQPELFAAAGGQANAWADADGDGDLDYFVAFRGRPNRFYRNDNGAFRDAAADVGLADNQETRSAAWGDFDADGDPDLFIGFADLELTNNDPDGGGHALLRNTAVSRGRGFLIDVADNRGRHTLAGSEVRVFQPGTRRLLAAGLVDGGSGYCSQNAMPVHVGVPPTWPGNVDVELTIVGRGRRVVTARNVAPGDHRGKPLRLQSR